MKEKVDLNFILEWSACVITLMGVCATSFKKDPLNIYFLVVACSLYVVWAIRIRKPSMLVVNGVVIVIYAFGLYNRFVSGSL